MKIGVKTNICEIEINVNDVINNKSINEALSSEDKSYIRGEIEKRTNVSKLERDITDVVKKGLKRNGFLEKEIVEIVSNCITQAYKQIWMKRGVWKTGIDNKTS